VKSKDYITLMRDYCHSHPDGNCKDCIFSTYTQDDWDCKMTTIYHATNEEIIKYKKELNKFAKEN